MTNTNYRMGAHLEREAKKMLEDQGYYVIRSAGSLGLFDLVAFNKQFTRFIQVRKNRDLSRREKDAIRLVPVAPGVKKEFWVKVPLTYGKFDIEVIE